MRALSLGHDRVGERDDVDALVQHRVGNRPAARLASPNMTGRDRVLAGQHVEALVGHPPAEQSGIATQGRALLVATRHQVERRQRAGDDRRRDGVGEQVGTRPLAQQLDDLGAGAHVAAGRAA